jgi:ABC-type sugar transport system ATPase subunit
MLASQSQRAPFLRVERITKRYDGALALSDATVSFAPGEVHALTGENGAGKSTLGKIVAGAVPRDGGDIYIDGKLVDIQNPRDAQLLGIAIIFQELDLFPHLSIAENIVIGNLKFIEQGWVSYRRMETFCRPFLDRVGLNLDSQTLVGLLSISKMQLVAIARALSMEARLIVMDEATSALTEEAVETLFGVMNRLRDSGVAIVFVSHRIHEIYQICTRATVLRDGRVVNSCELPATAPQELIKLMVGRDLTHVAPRIPSTTSRIRLIVDRLTTSAITDVSFQVAAGEVMGIAGLVGAGRSELGNAIFGRARIISGSIRIDGRDIQSRSSREAIRNGIGLLPEDRKQQGLMMQMGVDENASISILNRLSRFGLVNRRREFELLTKSHIETGLKAPSRTSAVRTLSGGNQQKVLLERWLLVNPDVIFLDDPTRGVDVGAKEDIYRIIAQLAEREKAVLLVSSELPELLRCSDRIMVLQNGCNRGILESADATQEQILGMAAHDKP